MSAAKTLLAASILLGPAPSRAGWFSSDKPPLQGQFDELMDLIDETGAAGADTSAFKEASDRARALVERNKIPEAGKVLAEAAKALRKGKARGPGSASPMPEDWSWAERLSPSEQMEPLPNEFSLVASERDYSNLQSFLEAARAKGIIVRRAGAADYSTLKRSRIVVVAGNPGSDDGVGPFLRRLLVGAELDPIAKGERMFLVANAFRPRQTVVVFSAPRPRDIGRLAMENGSSVFSRVEPPPVQSRSPRLLKLRTALSEDGVHWVPEDRPVMSGASAPRALKAEGGIRLYFMDGFIRWPDCAFSEDGLSWRLERFRIRGLGYDGEGIENPDVLELPGGSFRLYFSPGPKGTGLLSAVSPNGVHFTPEPGVRFKGKRPAFHKAVCVGTLVRLYYMEEDADRIQTAVSRDGGLTFKKEASLDLRSSGSFDLVETDDGWRLYYGRSGNPAIASSRDGISWKDEGAASFPGADPSVVRLGNGRWRMFYTAR
jgi:hypothetical protein